MLNSFDPSQKAAMIPASDHNRLYVYSNVSMDSAELIPWDWTCGYYTVALNDWFEGELRVENHFRLECVSRWRCRRRVFTTSGDLSGVSKSSSSTWQRKCVWVGANYPLRRSWAVLSDWMTRLEYLDTKVLTANIAAIRQRLLDSRLLLEHDRCDGAFILALVAVSATARLRYPTMVGDRRAFEEFLRSNERWPFNRISSVEFRGAMVPFATVFYRVLRCNLVHEGTVPMDVVFLPDNGLSLRAGGAPEYVLHLSQGWFYALVSAVEETLNQISLSGGLDSEFGLSREEPSI